MSTSSGCCWAFSAPAQLSIGRRKLRSTFRTVLTDHTSYKLTPGLRKLSAGYKGFVDNVDAFPPCWGESARRSASARRGGDSLLQRYCDSGDCSYRRSTMRRGSIRSLCPRESSAWGGALGITDGFNAFNETSRTAVFAEVDACKLVLTRHI